jgi:hypothetical protein
MEIIELQPLDTKLTVIINGNYQEPLTINKRKYWMAFYGLAEKKQMPKDRDVMNYFNTNKANPIYSRLGYKLTTVISLDGSKDMKPKVPITIISQKKFTQRKNKAA